MVVTKRRAYTKAERQAVLLDVPKLGVCAAAAKHGVPKGCVIRWASVAGVRRQAAATASSPTRDAAKGRALRHALPDLPEPPHKARRPLRSRVAKIYTPSQKAQALEHAAAHGLTAAAAHFDISRFSIYDWQRKARKAAAGGGTAPTSGPAPQDVQARRDQEILGEWHKHPGSGRARSSTSRGEAALKSGCTRRDG
jgi:hypothetical protein